MEGIEVTDGEFFRVDKISEGEGCEDIEVAAVGGGERNFPDEGDFFEDVAV